MTQEKFVNFLQNAKELNKEFGIIPLIYGSLGLGLLLEKELNPDDIDILIPEHFIKEDWSLFKARLERLGYQLIDEHEHTFLKGTTKYSYASIEDLFPFAGIPESEINIYQKEDIKYKLLTLEQYLKVYERSSLDGYRINKKEKKDFEKIEYIKQALK